jgi:predicted ATPase
MLTRLHIQNFQVLRDVDVPLKPLTVLVGANDSGKTTFLGAIKGFANPRDLSSEGAWRGQHELRISIEGDFLSDTGILKGQVWRRSNEPQSSEGQWGIIQPELGPLVSIQLPPSGPSISGQTVSDVEGGPPLSGAGNGVAALLDHLQRRDRSRFDRFVAAARTHIPGLADIALTATAPDSRRVDLHIEGGFELDADRVSAGVRTMLFFLALAYHPRPPRLLLIEEPENGLHPRRLGDVVGLLRSLTVGDERRQPAQIVLSTHSPYLLDHIDPEKDQVLVFRRGPEGEALVEPADTERLRLFLDELMLGEVWFNRGEEGLIHPPDQPSLASSDLHCAQAASLCRR